MNKEELLTYLKEKETAFEMVEHPAAYTVEEALALNLPFPEAGAKNLFLRDDKKRNYYLLVVYDSRNIDLKEIQSKIGSRRLSFASEEDLMRILKLEKGSVTSLGILNDDEKVVQVYFDKYFENHLMTAHPNINTATLYLNGSDVAQLLKEHGNPVQFIEL